jgi:hypothetical protein
MNILAAVCTQGCDNGVCSGSNVCACNAGWSGARCDIGLATYLQLSVIESREAVCLHSCVHGTCTTPNTCTCDARWGGNLCDECAEGWTADNCTSGLFISSVGYLFSKSFLHQQSAKKAVTMELAQPLMNATATLTGLEPAATCAPSGTPE